MEQLCASQAVLCTDLRQTLPNLANLLLTVTSRAATAAAKASKLQGSDAFQLEEQDEPGQGHPDTEQHLREAITSPNSPAVNGTSEGDLREQDAPASSIKPRKRAKSPTPSEKFRLVNAPSSQSAESGRSSGKEVLPKKGAALTQGRNKGPAQSSIAEQAV